MNATPTPSRPRRAGARLTGPTRIGNRPCGPLSTADRPMPGVAEVPSPVATRTIHRRRHRIRAGHESARGSLLTRRARVQLVRHRAAQLLERGPQRLDPLRPEPRLHRLGVLAERGTRRPEQTMTFIRE